MRQLRLLLLSLMLLPTMALARQSAQGDCVLGGRVVVTNGLNSTTKVMASYPSCTVQVNIQGGGLATIYSDNNGTVLANPFTATTGGHWQWYADNGRYSVLISGGTPQAMPSSFTYSDIVLDDNAQSSTIVCGLTFNASITFTAASCSDFTLTLTGNVISSTVTGAVTGQQLNISLCQDATGSRTFAWPPTFTRPPTISAVASSCTNTQFFFDGTNWRQAAATGDTLIANGGVLTGTYSGTHTYSGNVTHSGITSFTGNTIFTSAAPITVTGDNPVLLGGSLTARRFSNVRYADQFAGADIGAQINSAYADCPAQGCTIYISPSAAGTCYNFSTPITFNTLGKPAQLVGLAAGTQGNAAKTAQTGTCLNYTPTTATVAITFDFDDLGGGTTYAGTAGLYNIVLINNQCVTNGGCASSATGVQNGGTNAGARGLRMQDSSIMGFGKCKVKANAGGVNWGENIYGGSFAFCTTANSYEGTTVGENDTYNGVKFVSNGKHFDVPAGKGMDITIVGGSVDSATTCGIQNAGTSYVNAEGVHWENAGTSLPTKYTCDTNLGLQLRITDGQAFDDVSGGTNSNNWFQSALANVKGLYVFGGLGGRVQSVPVFAPSDVSFIQVWNGTAAWTTTTLCNQQIPCYITNINHTQSIATMPPIQWVEQGDPTCPGAGNGIAAMWANSTIHRLKACANGTAVTPAYTDLAQSWSANQQFAGGAIQPTAAGGQFNTPALPFNTLYFGTAATNNFLLSFGSTTAARTINIVDPLQATVTLPFVIASGTSTMAAGSVGAAACAAAVTTASTGTLTTDSIEWAYATAPTLTTDALLHVSPYVTANNVNWTRCNPTAGAIVGTAIVINWRVIR